VSIQGVATDYRVGQASLSRPEATLMAKSRTSLEPGQTALTALDTQSQSALSKQKSPQHHTPLLAEFIDKSAIVVEVPVRSDALPPDEASRISSPPDSDDTPRELAEAPPEIPQDPELGVLEVADPRRDAELGVVQLRNPLQDPELGILELRQFSPPPPPSPSLFIATYVAASSSDNVFLVQDPVQGRFGDTFIRPGISVFAFPSIGPQTNLLASAETNFLRYDEQSASNYDELRVRAAIRHQFTSRVYGQVGVSSQLLFEEGFGDQFFTNNSIEWSVRRRDQLTPQLILDSFYQGSVSFTDPSEFSNVLNSVGSYLGYQFAPQWETGIAYRFSISDFTRQSRREAYQRITGQLRYAITPSVRVSLFGGLSYGRSSEDRINFDDSFVGISFDATIWVY
jgi:hypothetical protein